MTVRRARALTALIVGVTLTALTGCAASSGGAGSAGSANASSLSPSSSSPAPTGLAPDIAAPDLDSTAAPTPYPTRYLPTSAELDRTYATTRMRSMSLADKIATMFMVHVGGTDPASMQAYLTANQPGGFILLGDNVAGPAPTVGATMSGIGLSAGLSPLISIDEEGGDVARLNEDTLPGADRLRSMPVQATTDAFTQRAALLKQAGVSVNFGTVADVTADPASFIYDRVLGTDPQASSDRVAASVAAENGVVFSTLKHFPGHGETESDSHSSIPTVDVSESDWQARDAPSFAAGIGAGAELVMFGHLVYSSVDSVPASLSVRWHEMLRGQLGFTGVAVTDDMLMLEASGVPEYADRATNAVKAIAAGNDLLLYDGTIDLAPIVASVAAAVQSGQIAEEQIDESVVRILTLQRAAWERSHP
ncbi:glycoside hydrolase family 3 N-terminal domain-containing protein [Subtercola lobariae]|uniref:beta-N-acetylhexosaminidase n=1 Tax=Subtercola lobariae TaxID=1588641 RepID=A0A917EUA7_9MICO|nr:glycoside hydrolase family 3 N-terminal domain-containing protein [Subtercola lobariae]GGF17164.1 beta-N-acetylhexosaminidase [Subtercola lobariae]